MNSNRRSVGAEDIAVGDRVIVSNGAADPTLEVRTVSHVERNEDGTDVLLEATATLRARDLTIPVGARCRLPLAR